MAIDLIRVQLGEPRPGPYSFDDTQPEVQALLADYSRTYVDYDSMLKGGFQSLVVALVAELAITKDENPLEILNEVEAKWAN